MRIGVNALSLHPRIDGAGRYTRNILRALSELDRENEYILFLRRDNERLFALDKPNFVNIPTDLKRSEGLRSILSDQIHLPRMAREHRVDILWSPSDIAPQRIHCPSIVTIHDLKRFALPHEYAFIERQYYKWYLKKTVQSANLIFTVSESSGRDIMNYLGITPERIIVAHNGLDPDIIAEEEGVPLETIQRIHNLGPRFILFVGQLIKSKNVCRMIRVFLHCQAAREYQFVLLGQPGSAMHDIEQTMRKESKDEDIRKRIRLVSWVPTEQLVAFYKNAAALFFASLYEGFGFPLVEAMACGLPIITSNVSSMPEVVGDAGCLVDPMDEPAMEQALSKILTNEWWRSHLIMKGRIRINNFSWENTALKYLEVFKRLKKGL